MESGDGMSLAEIVDFFEKRAAKAQNEVGPEDSSKKSAEHLSAPAVSSLRNLFEKSALTSAAEKRSTSAQREQKKLPPAGCPPGQRVKEAVRRLEACPPDASAQSPRFALERASSRTATSSPAPLPETANVSNPAIDQPRAGAASGPGASPSPLQPEDAPAPTRDGDAGLTAPSDMLSAAKAEAEVQEVLVNIDGEGPEWYDAWLSVDSRAGRQARFRGCIRILENRMNPRPASKPAAEPHRAGLTEERERQLTQHLLLDVGRPDASWFDDAADGEQRYAGCRALLRMRVAADEAAARESRRRAATVSRHQRENPLPGGSRERHQPDDWGNSRSSGQDGGFSVPWFDSTLADGSRAARQERFRLCAEFLEERLIANGHGQPTVNL